MTALRYVHPIDFIFSCLTEFTLENGKYIDKCDMNLHLRTPKILHVSAVTPTRSVLTDRRSITLATDLNYCRAWYNIIFPM